VSSVGTENTLTSVAHTADAWLSKALVSHEQGDLETAKACYQRVLAEVPEHFKALYLLGTLEVQCGAYDSALTHLGRAHTLKPHVAKVCNGMGVAYEGLRRYAEAAQCFSKAVELDVDYVEAYRNLGDVLNRLGQGEQAAVVLECAVRVDPNCYEAHLKLANTYKRANRLAEAESCLHTAIALSPRRVEGHYLLGTVLELSARIDDAVASYCLALECEPKHRAARWNRALLWLLQGKFEEAWPDYELGVLLGERPRQDFRAPRWTGASLQDKRILVWAEQGYGDVFQFVRYLPLLRERGARVIFQCPQELHELLRGTPGIDNLIGADRQEAVVDEIDFHAALLSLPGIVGTTLQTIPTECGYISADPQRAAAWRARLQSNAALKIGIAWSGNTAFKSNARRSCTLRHFSRLAELPGLQFYSLQKGTPAEQAVNTSPEMALDDLSRDIRYFADTAAIIDNLDLVISVDTSVAHLAGAMGKPVWTLLAHMPDWRWLLAREDSPWYPTMRLFRQEVAGGWDSVFAEVMRALRKTLNTSLAY